MTIPVRDHINRVGGIVSGQALAALADTAMVFALHRATDRSPRWGRSRPARSSCVLRGDAICAEAEITRAGRTMFFARRTLIEEPPVLAHGDGDRNLARG